MGMWEPNPQPAQSDHLGSFEIEYQQILRLRELQLRSQKDETLTPSVIIAEQLPGCELRAEAFGLNPGSSTPLCLPP